MTLQFHLLSGSSLRSPFSRIGAGRFQPRFCLPPSASRFIPPIFRSGAAAALFRTSSNAPVYLRRPLSLHGSAEEIYVRMAHTVADMIGDIISGRPAPIPQAGAPTTFKRRTAEQSRLPEGLSLEHAFDHIRMLDAEGYPRSFATLGGLRLEFRNAVRRTDSIEAIVTITRKPDDP